MEVTACEWNLKWASGCVSLIALRSHTYKAVHNIVHNINISYKVGRKIFWDKKNQNFGNDKQANDLISPKYNNGFKLPG